MTTKKTTRKPNLNIKRMGWDRLMRLYREGVCREQIEGEARRCGYSINMLLKLH